MSDKPLMEMSWEELPEEWKEVFRVRAQKLADEIDKEIIEGIENEHT